MTPAGGKEKNCVKERQSIPMGMKKAKAKWQKYAGDFQPGDVVEIIHRLPHADIFTPERWTLGYVAAVDPRTGNFHPVLVRSLNDPGKEDWFSARELALLVFNSGPVKWDGKRLIFGDGEEEAGPSGEGPSPGGERRRPS